MSPAADDWPVIPDGIQPIVAYRAWRYDGGRQRDALQPFRRGFGWHKGWNLASCLATPRGPNTATFHRAPAEGCSCGFYALKEPRYVGALSVPPGMSMILGKVELAGKIIEHTAGYRAERARVVQLLPMRGQRRVAKSLATIYGVDVSRQLRHLRPPSGWAAPPAASDRMRKRYRTFTKSGMHVAYLFLLSQILVLVSKDVRGWGLASGIGAIVAIGILFTFGAVHYRPRGGRAARPTNPLGRVGSFAEPLGAWRGRRATGFFMLPRGD